MRGLDRLALRERTIADYLRRAGYATGLVGKWHNGALDPRYHPNRRGFDEFAGFCGGWSPYVDWRLDRNGSDHDERRPLPDRRVHRRGRRSSSSATAREPFFLHLAYNAPHYPVPRRSRTTSRRSATPARFTTRRQPHLRHDPLHGPRHRARARGARPRTALAENTLVLFSSDNGPQFGGAGEMCTRPLQLRLRRREDAGLRRRHPRCR